MTQQTTISRDPFARESLQRSIEHEGSCAWCGSTRRNGSVFRYGVNRDDNGRTSWDAKVFCSLSCRNAYYG